MWFQSNKCTLFEEFFFNLLSPFIHHGHLHRVAYVSIRGREWMNIKSIIKSTEFWGYVWWYCIHLWYSNFSKCIIQRELWNIRFATFLLSYFILIVEYFGLYLLLKPRTFNPSNFTQFYYSIIHKIDNPTHKKKLFSQSVAKLFHGQQLFTNNWLIYRFSNRII